MLPYAQSMLSRADLDALPGVTALDFGTDACGYCQAAKPHIEAALVETPGVLHMKIEDGPGRPLGRSFDVKLWPTLVVLQDGIEVARVVRPADVAAVREALTHANRIADESERPRQTIAP